ncbi:MAG: LysM peptidoglycan-binding domain-containing protein [Victivallales bacterium]|nr:LysM peptidoglycan-binding domain-containing protein [Victivallales bacterium]
MKFKVLFILTGVIILHVLILTGVGLTGGCKSTSVLGPRPFIKAPPPQEEIVGDEEIIDINEAGSKVIVTNQSITPKAMTKPPVFNLGDSPTGIYYIVRKNDSFWKIARKHGVTMQSLAAYNDMPLSKILRVGDKLRIPPGAYVVKKVKAVTKAVSVAKVKPQALPTDGIYVVKSGDSFWKIAKRYNLKTKTLLDANNMTGKETLSIGQKLIIPDGKKIISAPATEAEPKATDDSVLSILDSIDSPAAVKKPIVDIDIDANGDSERAVQVIKNIKVEDFAKQYNISTAMLKKLNDDYPADGIFKAESVVIIRSE